MNAEQAAQLLAKTQLFADLDDQALHRLASQAVDRSYRRHQLIFQEGDPGERLFAIVSGSVKLEVTSSSGDVMLLTTLKPLDTFGELALIDEQPRSATAEALEPTRLLSVSRPVFIATLVEQPRFADALLRSIGALLRRLTTQTGDLAFLDLPGRVAKLLLTLAERETGGEPADGPVTLGIQLTQTDLARMVAGSRQSVNRTLGMFQSRGLIEVHGRTITIKRPDLLRRRAGD